MTPSALVAAAAAMLACTGITCAQNVREPPAREPVVGLPCEGCEIVYVYHTDAQGIYPRDEAMPAAATYRHGRLRAWAETDDKGPYHCLPATFWNASSIASVSLRTGIASSSRVRYYSCSGKANSIAPHATWIGPIM